MKKLIANYRARAQQEVSARHVDILDGVRVLAIFIVAWFHIWQQSWLRPYIYDEATSTTHLNLEPLVRSGFVMVDVMLLISGFLLFLPYARRMIEGGPRPNVKGFYLKRALRILPSYWLCIAIMLFAFALPERDFVMDARLWKDLWTHLTFTHVFFYETYIATELNVVLWTLAIEVQFYLIFPLIARLFSKRPLVTWFVMVAAAFAFRDLMVRPQSDTNLWVNQLPTFLDVYANGMLAALCYVHLSRTLKHTRWTRLASTALAFVMLFLIWQQVKIYSSSGAYAMQMRIDWHEAIRIFQARYRFQFSIYASIFILAAANAGLAFRFFFSSRMMRVLAAVSFQYYIWHQFLAAKMRSDWRFPPSVAQNPNEVGEQPWQWLFTLCAFGFPLILSLILTYGFERPIAKLGWGLWTKRKERKAREKYVVSKGGLDA